MDFQKHGKKFKTRANGNETRTQTSEIFWSHMDDIKRCASVMMITSKSSLAVAQKDWQGRWSINGETFQDDDFRMV